ncbi:MAG TPA: 4,5-DOPA dioxygenase extradiol [Saprospirales bacterium]|nr:4,5-DOPA dioxygenase extradiol [Saprospirales bacterium]HAY70959.1 4,5-DOPA dioxygenase extradiol [Saprospirales bacterium]
MPLNLIQKIQANLEKTERMPVLFLGHGNPMNAITENVFTRGFRKMAEEIPKPKIILCISAHWETAGTFVTAMDHPRTIHDFRGFPAELYEVQYPAPGSPAFAKEIQELASGVSIGLDDQWGLDHGAWSVLKHLYPGAGIPVIQMSLDYRQPPEYHYNLGKQLAGLREKGVLIVGSGNLVHNLGEVDWRNLDKFDYGFDWALEAKAKMNQFIRDRNHNALIHFEKNGKAFEMAIPSPEHYLPLLYVLALQDDHDQIRLYNDLAVAGSLTMTSVKISPE